MRLTTNRSFGAFLLMAACSVTAADESAELDRQFETLLSEYGAATVGAGIIRNGELAWAGYFGEESPGVEAGPSTMFNVGSVTKTVTAELLVQLADSGTVSLDEPMSPYWIDPDLADDPRHELLTPLLAISHRTGFPNWRYMDPEFKLRFISEPGTAFGYSGEGMDYLARFLEQNTGEPFEKLVSRYVFEPMEIEDISITREDWVIGRLALPVDERGQRQAPYCSSAEGRYCQKTGQWSAADELVTTVEAYARFMIAVMDGKGISPKMQQERFTVITDHADDPILGCPFSNPSDCPVKQGYGLGWEIFEFADRKIVSHGGSDWSERAMVYFEPATADGIILFINGPASTSVDALIEGMRLLDPDSRMADMYEGWMNRYRASQ